jgi:hypothetical protein
MHVIGQETLLNASGYPRGKAACIEYDVPIQIVRNEVPQALQQELATGISSAIGSRKDLWEVGIASELEANAWDVEIMGPNNFHWARRFSGEDRDVEVISEAVLAAVLEQAA